MLYVTLRTVYKSIAQEVLVCCTGGGDRVQLDVSALSFD